MNETPLAPLPAPEALPLPAPAWLLQALLLLTFLLHLVAMNGLLGGALLALWARRRARRAADPASAAAASDAAKLAVKLLPTLFAATVTFGVAPLLFLQALHGRFFFTSSVLMAWPWLGVVALLLAAYYASYLAAFGGARREPWRGPLLGAVAAIAATIAFVYTNNTTLMLRPDSWGPIHFADPGGWNGNLRDGQVWPRWLHMVLGALAVGGLWLALWGSVRRRRDPAAGAWMRHAGLGALAHGTMGNVLVGFWFLVALERPVMLRFMGGSPHATGLLGLGLLLALLLIALAVRARARPDGALGPVAWVAAVTLAAMVLMRDEVRAAYLAPHAAGAPAVAAQWANVALFAALLVGAAATVVWMARKLAAARPE